MKNVTIYSDGACSGNPGPGGYGVVLIFNQHRKELSKGYRYTTNNRMELMAVIAALKSLKEPSRVTIHSDSKYIVDAINKGWARRWRSKGWKRNNKKWAENVDLWEKLLRLIEEHDVRFNWVKGHQGLRENERSDQLAVEASQSEHLSVDKAFESGQTQPKPPSLFNE